MYGGHITDAFDRRTNNTYLKTFIVPEVISGMSLASNLKCPDPTKFDYAAYAKYIEEKTPVETPQVRTEGERTRTDREKEKESERHARE